METIFGLLLFIANVWGAYNAWQSSADTLKKVLWTVVIFALPVVGLLIWYFLGPKAEN